MLTWDNLIVQKWLSIVILLILFAHRFFSSFYFSQFTYFNTFWMSLAALA